jgi:hypothetical protein
MLPLGKELSSFIPGICKGDLFDLFIDSYHSNVIVKLVARDGFTVLGEGYIPQKSGALLKFINVDTDMWKVIVLPGI